MDFEIECFEDTHFRLDETCRGVAKPTLGEKSLDFVQAD